MSYVRHGTIQTQDTGAYLESDMHHRVSARLLPASAHPLPASARLLPAVGIQHILKEPGIPRPEIPRHLSAARHYTSRSAKLHDV